MSKDVNYSEFTAGTRDRRRGAIFIGFCCFMVALARRGQMTGWPRCSAHYSSRKIENAQVISTEPTVLFIVLV